jgi:hypothetical protein
MGHVTVFYFVSESVGYIAGTVYPDGGRFFRTADGGRSWDAIAYDDMPFTAIFEVSGRHFGVKGSRILDLQGRAVPLTQAVAASLPGPEWSVSDISAAGDGMVLVELVRGDRDTAPVRNLRWLTVPLAPR